MTFDELINSNIKFDKFRLFKPYNLNRAIDFFKELVTESRKNQDEILTCCVGDWDVDGLMSLKGITNPLDDLGIKNYDIYFGTEKTHGLTREFVNLALDKQYKYIIIVDSSSECMEEIKYLTNMGVKVLIIDHHVCNYKYSDYPKSCIIINAKMDGNNLIKNISAGMLVYLVMAFVRNSQGLRISTSDLILGYISLISDNCDLSDYYIKPIILGIGSIKEIPREIALFTDKYTVINKNFFIYKFNNIVNNVFRMERIDLITDVFFSNLALSDKALLVEEMRDLHNNCKKEIGDLAEKSANYIEDLGSCIMCDVDKLIPLTTLPKNYLINSTGLIASRISDNYGKAAIAHLSYTGTHRKFSGRDTLSRFPFQSMLRALNIDGGGHIGAVGFEMPIADLDIIKDYCMRLPEQEYSKVQKLILPVKTYNEEFLTALFFKVAMYNEICYGAMKPITLKIELKSSKFLTKDIGKLRIFTLGKLTVKDLLQTHMLDESVEIEPTFNDFTTAKIVNF